MRFASINSAVLGFLLLTTVAAVYVIASPGSDDNWIINPLTGITAIAFSLLAFARLSVGAPNKIARHIWQGTILVFCTVAASQFLEGYRQLLSQKYGIDDIADCVLLVVSPVTMWMISKFDPPPLFTRGLFLLGFLLQSVSTALDVLNALFISHWGWDTAFIDLITDLGQFASLQIYLIAVATFLVSLHLHRRLSSRGTRTVGQLSRYLFVRLRLFDKLRYPRLPFRIPGVASLIALGLWWSHFATWVPLVGPQVRARYGKSVRWQVFDIFQLGLSSGLDARAYYMFDIYRQGGLESSASYLTLFETQNGLFQAIGDFIARPLQEARSPLKNKAEFHAFCADHQLPCIAPLILDEYNRLEQIAGAVPRQSRDVVLVPYRHAAIKGTELYQHIGNGRFLDKTGATLSSGEVFARQMSVALGQHALLMPRLVNHPDLAALGADTYAGLQVVTCMTPGHLPIVTHALVQFYLTERSWSGRPDMVAPIRLSDGLIGVAVPAGRNLRQQSQGLGKSHIEGRLLPSWSEIQSLALAAHAAFCDRFILAWDIAYTPAGPILAGASEIPDVELLQQAHHEPISESPLGLPLYEYLCLLEAN
jgi:hypothetical protein